MTTNTTHRTRRYSATGTWTVENTMTAERSDGTITTVTLESADVLDTHSNRTYRVDAFRVLVDGKAHRGKGGTIPFLGESAWSDGERLFFDTVTNIRFAR